MARARNIKPGFFVNDELAEVDPVGRLLFIGLWTLADREGRLKDRPQKIKVQILPYDDNCDVDNLLNQLQEHGFIIRYEVDSCKYLQIINFVKHQNPHYKEVASEIPPPEGHVDSDYNYIPVTEKERQSILERDNFKCVNCKSEDNLTVDHIVPRSRGGDSSHGNLQTLCRSCNTSKGNRLDYNSSSSQSRTEVETNANQGCTLIPDSLLLIPDSLKPSTGTPNKRAGKFTPPTVAEITAYCKERNNNVVAEKFHDFYQAKGWFVGKNKMKDWQAAVRTWEQRDKKENKNVPLEHRNYL